LPNPALRSLLDCVNRLDRTAGAEFTVECNPATLDPQRIETLAAAGVTRISLGIQSWNAELRRRLGRKTPLGEPNALVRRLRRAGIPAIGADLIYAIPGQTVNRWIDDIRRTCDLGVESLSTYALTVEEGSRLATRSGNGEGPGDEVSAAMWEAVDPAIAPYGLRRYEVSNAALPGRECRHNDAVWHGASLLGCGPAACSFDGRTRSSTPSDLSRWLDGEAPARDELPPERRAAEILAFGLRTTRGWKRAEFATLAGVDPYELKGAELNRLHDQQLLACSSDTIRPTRRGLLFADTIAEALL
jgi:oxygen-independent coproporphyrinogen-3 oxidase